MAEGLDAGWVTDLDLPRTAALRVLGNGVVPQQAAVALPAALPAPLGGDWLTAHCLPLQSRHVSRSRGPRAGAAIHPTKEDVS